LAHLYAGDSGKMSMRALSVTKRPAMQQKKKRLMVMHELPESDKIGRLQLL